MRKYAILISCIFGAIMPIFCGERIASVSAAKAKTTEDSKKNKTAVDETSLAGADMSLEDEKIDASLSDEDLAMCRHMGISEEEFLSVRKQEK